ncbi:MAG: putative tRNA-dihydrouridine synthase [Candidatus Anoxychlamydiales bacterium]|nr:putative tRNA-dihydrouridine synthase [Candidatus Anoxychlamydiales bacterium]NGX40466.1 putative tRNA-dihydrouridine synthase [Candidatus Anoxychlamydiales bacterium]
MSFKKDFAIGSLKLPHNIIYAPLAEYTDFAYRRLIRDFHIGLMFCEMIKMEALVREKSTKLLKYTKNMLPIGAQLLGANSNVATDAARKLEDLGFDIIDFNCGCPVQKVTKDGSGAAMLKNPKQIFEILKKLVEAVKIPVSIKIRLGWDDNSIVASEIVKIAIDAGAKMITIHGRTKKQGYSGRSNWDYIKECKNVAKNDILVIGNGDLYTPDDVKSMFESTNVDGVMIARGMLSSPWLSSDIESYFTNKNKPNISRKKILLKYISYLIEEKKDKAVFDLRRISGWFLRGSRDIKSLRIGINAAVNIDETIKLIERFNWEEE